MTNSRKQWPIFGVLRGGLFFFPFCAFVLHKIGAPDYLQFVLLGLAMLLFFSQSLRRFRYVEIALCGVVALLLFLFKQENLVRLYPFLMSLHFFLIFAFQDKAGTSFIESATERFRTLGARERVSLRQTIVIWQVGLAINTVVLGAFLVGFSFEAWAFYAGVASYGLLAVLFAATASHVWRARRQDNA